MMMKTDLTNINFKAKVKSETLQRSFPRHRSKTFLGRLLEETTSKSTTDGCSNQDWQFDFVCPVLLDRFRQAKSELFTFYEKSIG